MSIFGGSTANPYDDIVAKTTDENLTSENWELILNLCDKVEEEGEEGARQVVAALLKRLTHRNPNVQLYTLTLSESLSKNVGTKINREIASRAFTQGLERIIVDRNTHEKVRQRALQIIAEWTSEFESDPSLGIMEECYNSLKAKNYKFVAASEPPPPAVDDEIRRKEEEELQRVLEMSMQDKGGRDRWADYSLAASSGAGSSSNVNKAMAGPVSGTSSRPAASSNNNTGGGSVNAAGAYTAPRYQGGYQPARTPSPVPQQQTPSRQSSYGTTAYASPSQYQSTTAPPSTSTSGYNDNYSSDNSTSPGGNNTSGIVTRVRALHTFEPTEPGELAFEKGDIIKVVDRGYKDWWRGQLKGRTGIFPVNYVEPLPEPTAAELAKEAEQEAAVFAQAVNVEKLLNMLRAFDPAKDNLADNEEIQELYRSSMALRPKIVKLIDKYSQKRADLVSMNETFVRARTIFDRMMEESLARHTGVYDQGYRPPYATPRPDNFPAPAPRPDSRAATGAPRARPEYTPSPAAQAYGWNPAVYDQPGYNAFPAPSNAYTPGPGGYPASGPTPTSGPGPAGHQLGGYPQQQGGYAVPQGGYTGQQSNVPYGQQGPNPYPVQTQQGAPSQQQPQQPQQQPIQVQSPPLSQSQQVYQPQGQTQPQAQHQTQVKQQLQAQSQPQAQTQPHLQPQPQQQPQSQPQPQSQSQPTQAHVGSPQVQPQTQLQPGQAVQQHQSIQQQKQAPLQHAQSGPPYVFDPNTTYTDPNVQAWAQYYAQGGRDLAGAVYFVNIPGLTDAPKSPSGTTFTAQQGQGQSAGVLTQTAVSSTENLPSPVNPQQIQPQQGYQQSQDAESTASIGYGANPGSPTQQLHQSPTLQALPTNVTSNAGYSPHPTPQAASSTPSWVLPKKSEPKAGAEGAGSSSYSSLPGQFTGLNVSDPSNAGQSSAT